MKTIILLITTMFILSCAVAPLTQDEIMNADFGAYPTNYQQMIQDYMNPMLFDPFSAVYYFGTPTKIRYGKQYAYAIPTDINARNKMGGYVGRKRFCFVIHNDKVWRTNPFSCGQ